MDGAALAAFQSRKESTVKKVLYLALGIAAGVVAIRLIQQTPRGREIVDDVELRIGEFAQAVRDGYVSRETELRGD